MKYCIYCGKENQEENEKCSFCSRKLDGKAHLFREYLKEHLIEDAEGKALDKVHDWIFAFFKKYAYGIFLTLSVVTSSISIVLHQTNSPSSSYEEVTMPPVVSVQYKGAGLDGNTVANRYAFLLQENNLAEAQAYQLDWYYPDLFETKHDIYDQRDIYFKEYDRNEELVDYTGKRAMSLFESFKPVYTDTCHRYEELGYHCDGATFEINYAYPNTFIAQNKLVAEIGEYAYQHTTGLPHWENGPYFYDLLLAFYTIEVDGNYYVVGDEALPRQEEYYRNFMEAKGDVSQLSFLKEYKE